MDNLEQYFKRNKGSTQLQLLNIGVSIIDESGNEKSFNDIINETSKVFLKLKENERKFYEEILKYPSTDAVIEYKNIRRQNEIIITSVVSSLVGIRNINKLSSLITDRMNELIKD